MLLFLLLAVLKPGLYKFGLITRRAKFNCARLAPVKLPEPILAQHAAPLQNLGQSTRA